MLINSAIEMKRKAYGTKQPRSINTLGEGAGTMQRSNSFVQLINSSAFP